MDRRKPDSRMRTRKTKKLKQNGLEVERVGELLFAFPGNILL